LIKIINDNSEISFGDFEKIYKKKNAMERLQQIDNEYKTESLNKQYNDLNKASQLYFTAGKYIFPATKPISDAIDFGLDFNEYLKNPTPQNAGSVLLNGAAGIKINNRKPFGVIGDIYDVGKTLNEKAQGGYMYPDGGTVNPTDGRSGRRSGPVREPIYTSDPNDPRLQAYSDSLFNFNATRGLEGISRVAGFEVTPEYRTRSTTTRPKSVYSINPKPRGNMKPSRWDHYVTGDSYDDSTGNINVYSDYNTEYAVARYDKPVQPVIYKRPDLPDLDILKGIRFTGFETNNEPLKLKPIEKSFSPSKVLLREMGDLDRNRKQGERKLPEVYMDDKKGWRPISFSDYEMYKEQYPGADTPQGWIQNNKKAMGGYIYAEGGAINPYMYYSGGPMYYGDGGKIWKHIGAGAYGILEGGLDTLTFGATDQLTDKGFEWLTKVGNKNIDLNDPKNAKFLRTQQQIRGYSNVAGAIGTAAFTGQWGSAIGQSAKGVNTAFQATEGLSDDFKKWSNIGSTAIGIGAGFAGGLNTQGAVEGLGEAATKFGSQASKYAPYANQAIGMFGKNEQPLWQQAEARQEYLNSPEYLAMKERQNQEYVNQGLSFAANGGKINKNFDNFTNSMRDRYNSYRNKYNKGGSMNKSKVDFISDESGLHRENANGGVILTKGTGTYSQGGPSLVEKGEGVIRDEQGNPTFILPHLGDGNPVPMLKLNANHTDFELDKDGNYIFSNETIAGWNKRERHRGSPLRDPENNFYAQERFKRNDELSMIATEENKKLDAQKDMMVQGALQYAAAGGKINGDIEKILSDDIQSYIEADNYYAYGGYLPKDKNFNMPNSYAKGGGIHIKKSKRGTFTAAAKKRGKSVQEFARQVLANKGNYSSAMVKKANFARNAAKWKHADGGPIYGDPASEYVYAGGGPMVSNVPQPFDGPSAQNRGGMMIEYAMGGMMQQQGSQEEQMMQMVQQVAQMLQSARPEQVMQQLVQSGLPQDAAMQLIQAAMQAQEEMMPAQEMAYGGYIQYARGGETGGIPVELNPTQEHFANEMYKRYGKVVLTDKGTNETIYGTKKQDGTWDLNKFEVLTGVNSLGQTIGRLSAEDIKEDKDKVTPLGVWNLNYDPDIYGMPGYTLGDMLHAYHVTYKGPEDPNRSALFNNNNLEDNYRSYGCINCEKPSMESLLNFVGKNGVSTIIDSRLNVDDNFKYMTKNTPKGTSQYQKPKLKPGNTLGYSNMFSAVPKNLQPGAATTTAPAKPRTEQVKKQIQKQTQKQVQKQVQKQTPARQVVNQPTYMKPGTPSPMSQVRQSVQQPVMRTSIPSSDYRGVSIVDYLNSVGLDSSKENRAKLAKQYGIENYNYSAEDNLALLDKLRNNSKSSYAMGGNMYAAGGPDLPPIYPNNYFLFNNQLPMENYNPNFNPYMDVEPSDMFDFKNFTNMSDANMDESLMGRVNYDTPVQRIQPRIYNQLPTDNSMPELPLNSSALTQSEAQLQGWTPENPFGNQLDPTYTPSSKIMQGPYNPTGQYGFYGEDANGNPVSINPNMADEYMGGWRPEGVTMPQKPGMFNNVLNKVGKYATRDNLTALTQLAGPLHQFFQKKPEPFNYKKGQANLVDPTEAIINANRQLRQSEAIADYNTRVNAPNSGAYLSNVRANALGFGEKRATVGSGIRTQYDIKNADALNRFEEFNTAIENANIDAMQKDLANWQEQRTNALYNAGATLGGINRDRNYREMYKNYIAPNIGTGNYELVQTEDGKWTLVPKQGSTSTFQVTEPGSQKTASNPQATGAQTPITLKEDKTTQVPARYSLTPSYFDTEDPQQVKEFQDWMDTYHPNWVKGKNLKKGKGYGRFGPSTKSAYDQYMYEYYGLNPNINQFPI
jgi:hypothetical protein